MFATNNYKNKLNVMFDVEFWDTQEVYVSMVKDLRLVFLVKILYDGVTYRHILEGQGGYVQFGNPTGGFSIP
jgi:hypothetical protein